MRMDLSKQAAACREKAAECERPALLVNDEAHRKTYLELAQMWREMAAHGERLNDFFAEARRHEIAVPKRQLKR
jgi:hypothetical protein